MKRVLIISSLFSFVIADLIDTNCINKRYNDWLDKFNLTYVNNKEMYSTWLDNDKYINEINSLNLSYKLDHNVFSSLSHYEFDKLMRFNDNKKYFIKKQKNTHANNININRDNFINNVRTVRKNNPYSIDWRGILQPIQNQGNCGSCWAFSVACSIEAVNKIQNNVSIKLSEQYLVDCSNIKNRNSNGKNLGCKGGNIDTTFTWIKENNGMCENNDYPYTSGDTGKSTKCKQCNKIYGTNINGFVNVKPNSNLDLITALTLNPVSVAIDASSRDFQLYSSGVFGGKCNSDLNHAVNIVGYVQDKYYILRNSWGESWGENGYMLLQIDETLESGLCGVLSMPSYPVY